MARSGRFMQPQGLASLTDEASQVQAKSRLPHDTYGEGSQPRTPSPGKYSIKHEPVHQNQVPRPNGLLK